MTWFFEGNFNAIHDFAAEYDRSMVFETPQKEAVINKMLFQHYINGQYVIKVQSPDSDTYQKLLAHLDSTGLPMPSEDHQAQRTVELLCDYWNHEGSVMLDSKVHSILTTFVPDLYSVLNTCLGGSDASKMIKITQNGGENYHCQKIIIFKEGMTNENAFEILSNIALNELASDEVYKADMQLAKSQMLLSLQFQKKDPEFLQRMNEVGVNFEEVDDKQLEAIRDDIWVKFSKILNTVYFITNDNVKLYSSKEQLLTQCKIEYANLINHMLIKKYIPAFNSPGFGFSFWSSRLSQFEALKYYHFDDPDKKCFTDLVANRYFSRILCGWRTPEIEELSGNTLSSLNVTFDIIKNQKTQPRYEALAQFYWQAHSRAYASFITDKSKVKLFIQDSMQEDNYFYSAELGLVRAQEATIDLVFLRKTLNQFLIKLPITQPIVSIRPFKKGFIISTEDGSILQLSRNSSARAGDYVLSVIRVGKELSLLTPDTQKIYLSKKEVLELFQPTYTAEWVDEGSIDLVPLEDLFIRRVNDHFIRSEVIVRALLADDQFQVDKSSRIETTQEYAKNPFREYCVYTAYATPKSSIWKMAYEKLCKSKVDVLFDPIDGEEEALETWLSTHRQNDVLYYRTPDERTREMVWKKITINEGCFSIEPVCQSTQVAKLLNQARPEAEFVIKIQHAHYQEIHRPQLFGAKFFIKELLKKEAPIELIIDRIEQGIEHVAHELRASPKQRALLAYMHYDFSYELNHQLFNHLPFEQLMALRDSLKESTGLFKSTIVEMLEEYQSLEESRTAAKQANALTFSFELFRGPRNIASEAPQNKRLMNSII